MEKICEKLKKKDSQICDLKYGKKEKMNFYFYSRNNQQSPNTGGVPILKNETHLAEVKSCVVVQYQDATEPEQQLKWQFGENGIKASLRLLNPLCGCSVFCAGGIDKHWQSDRGDTNNMWAERK